MKIEIVQAPGPSILNMLMSNINGSSFREQIQPVKWGAVGLIQAHLVELYRATDLAEKASDVKTALISGNCPQHVQMLAVFGNPAAVRAALDKVAGYYGADFQ